MSVIAVSFADAIRSIPDDTPRRSHGRTPEEGLDCAGLMFHVYRECGIDLSDLDVPYTESQEINLIAGRIPEMQILRRFEDITRKTYRRQDEDGDIWVVVATRCKHFSIFAENNVYHMADRLRCRSADRMRGFVVRSFRMKG